MVSGRKSSGSHVLSSAPLLLGCDLGGKWEVCFHVCDFGIRPTSQGGRQDEIDRMALCHSGLFRPFYLSGIFGFLPGCPLFQTSRQWRERRNCSRSCRAHTCLRPLRSSPSGKIPGALPHSPRLRRRPLAAEAFLPTLQGPSLEPPWQLCL